MKNKTTYTPPISTQDKWSSKLRRNTEAHAYTHRLQDTLECDTVMGEFGSTAVTMALLRESVKIYGNSNGMVTTIQ